MNEKLKLDELIIDHIKKRLAIAKNINSCFSFTLPLPKNVRIYDGETYKGSNFKTYNSKSRFILVNVELDVKDEMTFDGTNWNNEIRRKYIVSLKDVNFQACAFEDGGKLNRLVGKMLVSEVEKKLDLSEVQIRLEKTIDDLIKFRPNLKENEIIFTNFPTY